MHCHMSDVHMPISLPGKRHRSIEFANSPMGLTFTPTLGTPCGIPAASPFPAASRKRARDDEGEANRCHRPWMLVPPGHEYFQDPSNGQVYQYFPLRSPIALSGFNYAPACTPQPRLEREADSSPSSSQSMPPSPLVVSSPSASTYEEFFASPQAQSVSVTNEIPSYLPGPDLIAMGHVPLEWEDDFFNDAIPFGEYDFSTRDD